MRIEKKFREFVTKIKSEILESQYKALQAVNKELINLYWNIGKQIFEKQKNSKWGDSIVENLSKEIQKEIVGIKGFSVQNLWYMKQFYESYYQNEKLQPLVGEISWVKNCLIISKCKDDLQREFYIKMTKKFGWSKNILKIQIENQTFEKYLTNQTNFEKNLPENLKSQAKIAIKDEYTFDFLEISKQHSEREFEKALLSHVKDVLNEFGGYFSFIGSQYKLNIEGEEYYIDLLLFHRKLKSLVAVELKIGEFKPEMVGKMNFYLSVLNDKVKMENENPSIGIILCKEKNRTIVEYSLKDSSKPIGISTYNVSNTLPKEFKGLIPSPKEIEKRLEGLEK